MQVIDAKAHGIAPDITTYPPVSKESWEGRPPSSWERLIEHMDEAGIAKTVLVQSSSTYGYDNSYVADGPKTYPDRFVWVGSVDVLAPDAANRVEYWTRERGMSGLRITTTARPDDTSWVVDPVTYPVWSKVQDLGIPVAVLSVGEAGLLGLEGILQRFPGLTLVMDHLLSPPLAHDARPDLIEAFFALAKHPTVYVEITGPEVEPENIPLLDRYLPRVLETFGPERLVFGSNFPTSPGPPPVILAAAKGHLSFLSEADQERVFSGNARKLYPALGEA